MQPEAIVCFTPLWEDGVMNSDDIDFSALISEELNDAEWVREHKQKGELYNLIRLVTILGLVAIAFIAIILLLMVSLAHSELMTILIVTVLIGVLFIIAIRKGAKKDSVDNAKLRRFAKANGFDTNTTAPKSKVLAEMNYSFDTAQISGHADSAPFWLHRLSAPTINNNEVPSFISLTTEVPKELPTLLVLPGIPYLKPFADSLAKTIGLSPLELEGDFQSHAFAYCRKGGQIHALEYLTPDVMAVLADEVVSVIIYADNLIYISSSEENDILKKLRYLFKDRKAIVKEILEKQT